MRDDLTQAQELLHRRPFQHTALLPANRSSKATLRAT